MILLIPIAYALSLDDADLMELWFLNESAGNFIGYKNNYVMTVSGSPSYHQEIDFTPFIEHAVNLDANAWLNVSYSDIQLYQEGWTIIFFMYMNADGEYQAISTADGDHMGFWFYLRDNQDKNYFSTYGGGFSLLGSNYLPDNQRWCAGLLVNSTGGSIWRNGTQQAYAAGAYPESTYDIVFGTAAWNIGSNKWDSHLAYISVWNRSLSSTEISDVCSNGITLAGVASVYELIVNITSPPDSTYLARDFNITAVINETALFCRINDTRFNQTFNNGTTYIFANDSALTDGKISYNITCENALTNGSDIGYFYADTTPPDITFIHPTLAYNDSFNRQFFINITTNDITNCSINQSEFVINTSNTSFYSYFLGSALASDIYHVGITCNDSLQNDATGVVFFYYDVDNPTITFTSPNGDNTTSVDNLDNITFNILLEDNRDLYSFQINVTNSTSEIIFNQSLSLSGTLYNYSNYILTTELENTSYTLNYYLCDSHTADFISYADSIDTSKGSITYNFNPYYINLVSDDDMADFSTLKLDDRYIFNLTSAKKETQKIYLHSDADITYLPYSEYSGHFIIGKHWIDFEPYDVKVYQTNDYYTIEIIGSYDKLSFNSIGELNCISGSVLFELTYFDTNPYGTEIVSFNWFNEEAFETNTTAGVLMFMFLFLILIGLIVFSEHVAVPIIMLITSIFGFFVGIFFYATFSAIVGVIFCVLSVLYAIRAFAI